MVFILKFSLRGEKNEEDQEWKWGGYRNPGGVDQVLVWRLHKTLESVLLSLLFSGNSVSGIEAQPRATQ